MLKQTVLNKLEKEEMPIPDEQIAKNMQDELLEVLEEDFGDSMNKSALESEQMLKKREKFTFPSREDLQKLHIYVKGKMKDAYQNLKEEFTLDRWISLAQPTLTSIQLFNRCRPEEIERIEISDYKVLQKIDGIFNHDDSFLALSAESQQLLNSFVYFNIRGNLGRIVRVLLNPQQVKCIDLLLFCKRNINISETNNFIFDVPSAQPGIPNYLRACDLLRQFAKECGAIIPADLRGTKLREHVSHFVILLNVFDVVYMMDYGKDVHKDIYQEPVKSPKNVGVSQILEIVQGEMQVEKDLNPSYCNNEDDDLNFRIMFVNYYENLYNTKSTEKKGSASSNSDTIKRTRWTKEETDQVMVLYGHHIKEGTFPSFKVLRADIKKYPVLSGRTHCQIKAWLSNQKKKLQKNYMENFF